MLTLKEYTIQRGGNRSVYRQNRSKDAELEMAKVSPLYQKFVYQGWTIEPTIHSAARAFERRPDMEYEDWKKIHRRVIEWINKNKKTMKFGDHLFYSRSAQQGYVVAISGSKLRIVTVLPRKRSNVQPGTERIVVENKELDIVDVIEID